MTPTDSFPPGSAVITPYEMYQLILETKQSVDALAPPAETLRDHEARIRSLERKLWIAVGVAAGLSSGVTATISNLLGA